jgi:hypothetical protein
LEGEKNLGGGDNIYIYVKEIGYGVDSSGTGYIAVEDSCEGGNKGR